MRRYSIQYWTLYAYVRTSGFKQIESRSTNTVKHQLGLELHVCWMYKTN